MQLCCDKRVLKRGYAISDLIPLSSGWTVSLDNWRTATEVSIADAVSDPANNIEVCTCLANHTQNIVDLTSSSDAVSADAATTATSNWLCNTLYNLASTHREEVLSPSGWLSDSVIAAAQLLILQEFPHMCGLQSPVLQQTLAFNVHGGEFVQIIHVGGDHWCTVSNDGCDSGVVDVYNSICTSVSNVTLRVIASLVYSSSSKLVVRMMDVGRQSNSSDCGVLAIAFAYDVCSHYDPCRVKY